MNIPSFVVTPDQLMSWVVEILQEDINNHGNNIAQVPRIADKFMTVAQTLDELAHKFKFARELAFKHAQQWERDTAPIAALNGPPPPETRAAAEPPTAPPKVAAKRKKR